MDTAIGPLVALAVLTIGLVWLGRVSESRSTNSSSTPWWTRTSRRGRIAFFGGLALVVALTVALAVLTLENATSRWSIALVVLPFVVIGTLFVGAVRKRRKG